LFGFFEASEKILKATLKPKAVVGTKLPTAGPSDPFLRGNSLWPSLGPWVKRVL